MAQALLSVERLTKFFGGLRAVDIDLTVDEGELRCIIGPNGAGKSTLFKLLTGDLRPSSGTIRLRNEDIARLSPFQIARRGVSMKFQVPSLFDRLSVFENLHIVAERRFRFSEGYVRAERMLQDIGLAARADDLAAWLTHGDQQWLEIGMASVAEPELILLDEPTAGMGLEEVERTISLIKKLARRSTLMVIEHNMDFVRRIAQRVTVMHRGRVFADGAMADIEANNEVRDIYLGKLPHDADHH